jgi:hypothetical protein
MSPQVDLGGRTNNETDAIAIPAPQARRAIADFDVSSRATIANRPLAIAGAGAHAAVPLPYGRSADRVYAIAPAARTRKSATCTTLGLRVSGRRPQRCARHRTQEKGLVTEELSQAANHAPREEAGRRERRDVVHGGAMATGEEPHPRRREARKGSARA